MMDAESDEGRDALAFADGIERGDAATLAALASALQTAQAELDRLADGSAALNVLGKYAEIKRARAPL